MDRFELYAGIVEEIPHEAIPFAQKVIQFNLALRNMIKVVSITVDGERHGYTLATPDTVSARIIDVTEHIRSWPDKTGSDVQCLILGTADLKGMHAAAMQGLTGTLRR